MRAYNEAKIIVDSIKKAQPFNNEVIVKIGEDMATFKKEYEFQVVYGEVKDEDYDVECVEMTKSISTLNYVLKELLNNDYFISFDYIAF